MQQELSDKGIPERTIERHCHYTPKGGDKMNQSQKDSYLLNPPVSSVCVAAGGSNPKFHDPFWAKVWDIRHDALLDIIIPGFSAMLQRKRTQFYSMTHKQREDDRTYSSLGSLECIQLRLRRSLQLCASSERDPNGDYVPNQSLPYYQVWSHPVLSHPVFHHNLFLTLSVPWV